MLREIIHQSKTALLVLFILTLITGLFYPVTVTLLAQSFYPSQANGSLFKKDDKMIGSLLIGQLFTDPKYFWGRPSATSPFPYNTAASSGSNMGPINPDFLASVKARVLTLDKNSTEHSLIPVDLVTASGSGLDPDISPLAAFYQVDRVAKARHLAKEEVLALVSRQIKSRTFMLIGEPRINVLQLNLALDNLRSVHDRRTPRS